MTANRVVVHKRNQSPSPIDQLGTTIPMAELFAPSESTQTTPRAKPERPARLMPVPMEQADLVGDMPQASVVSRAIHAIVFDLEATLLDVAGWRHRSLERALLRFGHELPKEHAPIHDSKSTRALLEILTREHGFPRSLHVAVEQLESAFAARDRTTALRPGFEKEYLLVKLRREGYRLVACSRTDAQGARMALEASSLLPWFEMVVSMDDITQPSPSPELYLTVCDQLGLRPKQVLAIEADPSAIEAAMRAGVNLCRVRGREETEWTHLAPVLENLATRSPGLPSC